MPCGTAWDRRFASSPASTLEAGRPELPLEGRAEPEPEPWAPYLDPPETVRVGRLLMKRIVIQ